MEREDTRQTQHDSVAIGAAGRRRLASRKSIARDTVFIAFFKLSASIGVE